MRLLNSTVLVTGGSSGLGKACCERLVRAGGNVVIADVNEREGESVSEALGETARFVSTNITSVDDAQSTVCQAIDAFGSLDGLINCAGVLGAARVVGRKGPHDLELFRRVVEVNLVGTFNMLRYAASAMTENEPDDEGERGVIINTSSVAAFEGQIGQAAYSASKGGVASMTLPIARELAESGIRVVAIAPGIFRTPMMEAAPPQVVESLEEQTVFPKRLGEPDDFASLVQHIFENPMINGEVIRLDGAMRMGPK